MHLEVGEVMVVLVVMLILDIVVLTDVLIVQWKDVLVEAVVMEVMEDQ